MTSNPKLAALHASYCRLVMPLSLTMERLLAWEAWLAHFERALPDMGSTATPEQALRAIIAHRRRLYADKRDTLNHVLKFRHLVERPELAEEDFAAWIADRRSKATLPDPGRAAVLRATGRPETPPPAPARPAADIVTNLIAQMKQAAQ